MNSVEHGSGDVDAGRQNYDKHCWLMVDNRSGRVAGELRRIRPLSGGEPGGAFGALKLLKYYYLHLSTRQAGKY